MTDGPRFEVIPAIDLRGGRCVRLYQGDFAQETVFGDDPLAVARGWEAAGAGRLHLVDLDGAREGRPVQLDLVRTIASGVRIPVQLDIGAEFREGMLHRSRHGGAGLVYGGCPFIAHAIGGQLRDELVAVQFGRCSVGFDPEVELQVKGISDVYIMHNKIPRGGHTGWHSHPGISFVTVRAGVVTEYSGDDPGTPQDYPAGTGLVEEAGRVHLFANEGDTDVELVAFQVLPFGATRRIDQPAP